MAAGCAVRAGGGAALGAARVTRHAPARALTSAIHARSTLHTGLAQNRYLDDPVFLNYLKYLEYWRRPEYAKYIK